MFPSVLPDGQGVVFTVSAAGRADSAQVAVLDLRTGHRKTLVRGANQAEYVRPPAGSTQTGYLVYAVAGGLRAVGFDPVRLELVGRPGHGCRSDDDQTERRDQLHRLSLWHDCLRAGRGGRGQDR